LLRWADQIGPQTGRCIEAILESRLHPQQAYRSCLEILGLAKRHPGTRSWGSAPERLEAACARALPAGIRSYRGVKNILDTRLDQLQLEETISVVPKAHTNIRGPSYASGRVAGYYQGRKNFYVE
jgi:hypothetical protein